jgi:hypothetical protein
MKITQRIRLRTLLLWMIVIALIVGLYTQRRRTAELRATLSLYRDPITEGIFDVLDQPIALTYADGAHLEQVLKEIKQRSTGLPKLKAGIPIYVDPIGLQEAEKSMTSPVRRPSPVNRLTLGEQLRSLLGPLGLGYVVKDGFLMVTSSESLDMETGDAIDPYLQYRDVLR